MQPFVESVARITGLRDRDALTSTIAAVLYEWLHAHNIAIYGLLGEGEQRRVLLKSHLHDGVEQVAFVEGIDLQDLPLLSSMKAVSSCVRHAQPIEMADSSTSTREVLFPIQNGEAVVGVLAVEFSGSPSADHLGLINGVLKIINNMFAVLDYGERDTLTGLLNRKTFDHSFHKMLTTQESLPRVPFRRQLQAAPAKVSLQPVADLARDTRVRAIGLVDIDHFKSINDRFGHLYGDEVLLLLARVMRSNFRASDQLFRYGGEEFVIALDWTQKTYVHDVFERFRLAVEKFQFPQIGQVTVSIGVTLLDPLDTPAGAIERADQALYYAKNHGRNQVLLHEALVEQGLLSKRTEVADVELF